MRSQRAILTLIVAIPLIAMLGAVAWFQFGLDKVINLTYLLSGIGIVLASVIAVAWYMSNRAEAVPNSDQLAELERFVRIDFARFVANSLVATSHDPAASPSPTSEFAEPAGSLPSGAPIPRISDDEDWRQVFRHHIDLHAELHQYSKAIAMRVFTAYIDDAVRAELAERSARATNQAVTSTPT